MTKEEAFREWIAAAENHTWGYDDLWNAACDWQKQQDANLIYDKNKKYHPWGECYEADIRQECSGEIMCL